MFTIPELVKELVLASPYLEENLSQGLINGSALARQLKPEIEKRLYRQVQLGAIVTALNRLSKKLASKSNKNNLSNLKLGDISVRSNIVEYTFVHSPTLVDKQRDFLHLIEDDKTAFVTFSQGIFETTIFASSSLESTITEVFKRENLKAKFTNLSSVTLILPKEVVYVPGVYYSILKLLAWNGINFIEVISSYTELTIFLEKNNVDKAFSALKKLS